MSSRPQRIPSGWSRGASIAIGAACLVGVAAVAVAQAPAPAAPRPAPKPSVYTDYHPNLSDMMTMLIQPRHTKLGLGVRSRNWVYAGYEVGELRGAFRRIVASMPTYEGADTAGLVMMMTAPIDKLQAAIRAKDAKAADAAYAEVTDTCNMCHGTQNRSYIDIRVPTTPMYSDQDFNPMR
jgi:hypothetical protein